MLGTYDEVLKEMREVDAKINELQAEKHLLRAKLLRMKLINPFAKKEDDSDGKQ